MSPATTSTLGVEVGEGPADDEALGAAEADAESDADGASDAGEDRDGVGVPAGDVVAEVDPAPHAASRVSRPARTGTLRQGPVTRAVR
jgi:hypothetical protein